MSTSPVHPGVFVREHAIKPRKLTVSAAAQQVGVGRPAFSNFLNGKAAASPDMARRIEVAFGLKALDILAMQAAHDAANARPKLDSAALARPFVIPLLQLKAADIEGWVERNISARTRLAVFLRTLVNSTGAPTRINFPGNDNAEDPGWDGWSECEEQNPWVPAGKTGWEFGTNADIATKANADFEKSLKAHPNQAHRDEVTFIFVTPRSWPRKKQWAESMQARGLWKDVRAYDSSDLEQWLEVSVPGQAWLAAELGRPTEGVSSLAADWERWGGAAESPMPESLFDTAISADRGGFAKWLQGPPDKPFVIASDSVEEALAFLHLLLKEGVVERPSLHDRTLVFRQPGALTKLAQGLKDFVAVAATSEAEKELAPHVRHLRCIAIHPRNASAAVPHVDLQPLTSQAFTAAMEKAGYNRDQVQRLAKESGRSLTILRRRLSKLPGVKTPAWAQDVEAAKVAIPFCLCGAWSSLAEADKAALVELARATDYEALEERFQQLAAMPESPVWSVGVVRGVTSKIDALFATAPYVTSAMLERFLGVAKRILMEDDPRLDLPEKDRWAAPIYKKSRDFSAGLRRGVAETLVLLAVHGEHLYRARTGFNCEQEISKLIRELMEPVEVRKLEAAGSDLRDYAEAAPRTFLDVLQKDLESDESETVKLLRPVQGTFGGCPRSDLLWALEGLAWNPETLLRSSLLLARMAQVPITDNWSNKPIASLVSIFRTWMPQTAADHETRLKVIRKIAATYPQVGWDLLLKLLESRSQVGHYNHKPQWRNDGYGLGEPIGTWGPILEFRKDLADIALSWSGPYSAQMLCDLVDVILSLTDKQRSALWTLVTSWAGDASDADKAQVREKIRVSLLSKRAAKHRAEEEWAVFTEAARAAYKLLEPADVVHRNAWLFNEVWVQESADELFEEDIDIEGREKRIQSLRIEAVRAVLRERGIAGIRELALLGKAAHILGDIVGKVGLDPDLLQGLICDAFKSGQLEAAERGLIAGALNALGEADKVALLERLASLLTQSQYVSVLVMLEFGRQTWTYVDGLSEENRKLYWHEVMPWYVIKADAREAAERLLAAARPLAAFAVCQLSLEDVGSDLVYRILMAIAQSDQVEPGSYKIEQHWLAEAFELVGDSPNLSVEQKAWLEFAYVDALWSASIRKEKRVVPYLEKYVEVHPEFYVQALVWAFKRKEPGEDPEGMRPPAGKEAAYAQRAYKLLQTMRLPTFSTAAGAPQKNLQAWIRTIRTMAADLDRGGIADVSLGQLLITESPGQDGITPGELARQALEEIGTDEVANGARVAIMNSRGVVWRGRGGTQEREEAARYRAWAKALWYSHPFVADKVLNEVALQYEHMGTYEDESEVLRERLER